MPMIALTAPRDGYRFDHTMTHMDLYYKGRRPNDASLVTQCVLLDLTDGPEDVEPGTLPALDLVQPGDSVILKTGWEQYRGTGKYDDSPSVDERLIHALVERGIVLTLVDSPGVSGGAEGPEHNAMDKYLADNEAYAVENLVNVDRITERRFRLYCFPIPLTGMNTAPCRVVAEV
ncbi:MAG: cyclase family protein [Candidatus Brocadiia bacterium]